jgi:hypothetical protein
VLRTYVGLSERVESLTPNRPKAGPKCRIAASP